MKEHLAQLIGTGADASRGRNLVREYLHARILESLQRAGAMVPLAFHGGTALRFLYGIPRYSEDLDFALERDRERYDLRRFLRTIRSALEAEAYAIDLRVSDRRVAHSAFIRFPGLAKYWPPRAIPPGRWRHFRPSTTGCLPSTR